MLFSYNELKESVREDFDRFCNLGFEEAQIVPAVLDEYRHGENFSPAENLCIHLFLALHYQEKGFALSKIIQSINRLMTQELFNELQGASGTDGICFAADLSRLPGLGEKPDHHQEGARP